MRLIGYNILDGGEGRADPLAEVILANRPDIVVLVEAQDRAVLERIAARLKMDFILGEHRPKNDKKTYAAAILSRWPITESINHAPLHPDSPKSLLEATISEPTGPPSCRAWTIGAVHLHAHATLADEAQRLSELDVVLAAFAPHREKNRPHILCGDFNSVSPAQKVDPDRCKPATRKEWKANGKKLPRRAVEKLLAAGYIDALHAFDPAAADLKKKNLGTFTTQFPGQRVDYTFTFAMAAPEIARAWIEHDRLATYASDHFPIGLEITTQ
ncbi:MAG TPA: endonuclease/exonuclease/phosphatase family protein [Tepidisphaeraceae bacterium]|nr:endonuclease/exonuclease/phosphatase family protein [Tepidisphaeraceae bacterium]